MAALRDHDRYLGQYQRMGYKGLQHHIGGGLKLRRIEGWSKGHQATHRQGRQRCKRVLERSGLALGSRAKADQDQGPRVIGWPWRTHMAALTSSKGKPT